MPQALSRFCSCLYDPSIGCMHRGHVHQDREKERKNERKKKRKKKERIFFSLFSSDDWRNILMQLCGKRSQTDQLAYCQLANCMVVNHHTKYSRFTKGSFIVWFDEDETCTMGQAPHKKLILFLRNSEPHQSPFLSGDQPCYRFERNYGQIAR